jgi:hypothetical protein
METGCVVQSMTTPLDVFVLAGQMEIAGDVQPSQSILQTTGSS